MKALLRPAKLIAALADCHSSVASARELWPASVGGLFHFGFGLRPVPPHTGHGFGLIFGEPGFTGRSTGAEPVPPQAWHLSPIQSAFDSLSVIGRLFHYSPLPVSVSSSANSRDNCVDLP